MSRRFRPTDAFVDESIRGRRYLMACVLVRAHDMAAMRSDMVALAGTKSTRVHFNAELDSRRQVLLETFAAFTMSRSLWSAADATGSPSSRHAPDAWRKSSARCR